MSQGTTYDYIIVGGGSSACVVAARLVRDGKARVLMLERGPRKANPIMHFPAGYMKFLAKDTYLSMHQTKPQEQLNGRGPIVPQGKVLGGGSTVNAMVYMRGQAADYDRWNEAVTEPGYTTMAPGLTGISCHISRRRKTTIISAANSTGLADR